MQPHADTAASAATHVPVLYPVQSQLHQLGCRMGTACKVLRFVKVPLIWWATASRRTFCLLDAPADGSALTQHGGTARLTTPMTPPQQPHARWLYQYVKQYSGGVLPRVCARGDTASCQLWLITKS